MLWRAKGFSIWKHHKWHSWLFPSKHLRFTNVSTMLGQRRRRWANIVKILGEGLVVLLYLNTYLTAMSEWVNIASRRFLHNHGNIATEWSPMLGLCSTYCYRMTSRVLYSAQYHKQSYRYTSIITIYKYLTQCRDRLLMSCWCHFDVIFFWRQLKSFTVKNWSPHWKE